MAKTRSKEIKKVTLHTDDESIEIDFNDLNVTSIYFADNSVDNILANYYEERSPKIRISKDSPILDYAGELDVQVNDPITPKMVKDYWKLLKANKKREANGGKEINSDDNVNVILKCADSQPCDISRFRIRKINQ